MSKQIVAVNNFCETLTHLKILQYFAEGVEYKYVEIRRMP